MSSNSSKPRRSGLWMHVAALIAFPAAIGLGFIATRSEMFGGPPQDFRIFYVSAQAWRYGGTVYDAALENMNLPAVTLALTPLAWLSLEHAANVWWAISFVCLGLTVWVVKRETSGVQAVLLGSIVMISEAGFSNIRLGQIAFPVLLLATLAWSADRRGHERAAGAWLGATLYAKPFFALAAIYLLYRRAFNVLLHAAGIVMLLTFIGWAAGGREIYYAWFEMLRRPPNLANELNASVYGFLMRTLHASERMQPVVVVDRWIITMLWLGISGALLIPVAKAVQRSADRDRTWALALIWSVLASPIGWVHYLCVPAAPLMVTLRGTRAWAALWVALFPLIAIRYLALSSITYSVASTVFLASTYFWCALLLFVAVVWSRPEAGDADFS